MYSVSTDEVEHNCHFLAPSRNCMTKCQALTAIATKIIHTKVQLYLTHVLRTGYYCVCLCVCLHVDMVPYTVEQHVFLNEIYLKFGSTTKYKRKCLSQIS
jgi:hypothetical protein